MSEQQSLFPEITPPPSFKKAMEDPTKKRKVVDKKTGETKEVVVKYNLISDPTKHRLKNDFASPLPEDATPEEWRIAFHRLQFFCRGLDETVKDLTRAYRELQDRYLEVSDNLARLARENTESYNKVLATIEELAMAEGESGPQ